MPSEDSRRLERLLDAAGRAAQPLQPGWQTLPQRLARTAQARRRRFGPWLWLVPAPFGIAAAVALWIAFSSPRDVGTPLHAQELPIVVQRQDIELTVLSVAESEGETLYMPILQKLSQQLMPQPNWPMAAEPSSGLAGPKGTSRPYRPPARKLTGQALVKDHRLVLNLKKGDNTVRFSDVAASIDPTSVRFVSNTDPASTEVVEQNFEYDLAHADALLKRYLDRKIVCIAKDGQELSGYLASFDDQAIVLASEPTPPPGQGRQRSTQSLTRQDLQAIRLEEMPGDLLLKPTLVWKLRTKTPGQHDTTLSYLCGFVKWQADYVALVTPGEGQGPDLLDITGWVSLDNTSGATYEKAGLKLIAGDVNRVRDPWAQPDVGDWFAVSSLGPARPGRLVAGAAAKKEFVEKSFFEYHLYTLTAPSTVRDKEIKQLNLLQRKGIKAERRYVYDPLTDNRRLSIELVAKNDTDNHLGVPLPKGRVTLEQRDRDGEAGFLGHVEIDHTAVKEELKLKYGHAYDVTGEWRLTSQQQLGANNISDYEMHIRNHKTEQIQVRAVARLGLNWTITKSSLPFQTQDAQTVHFDFPLQANAEQVITYTVEYQR